MCPWIVPVSSDVVLNDKEWAFQGDRLIGIKWLRVQSLLCGLHVFIYCLLAWIFAAFFHGGRSCGCSERSFITAIHSLASFSRCFKLDSPLLFCSLAGFGRRENDADQKKCAPHVIGDTHSIVSRFFFLTVGRQDDNLLRDRPIVDAPWCR